MHSHLVSNLLDFNIVCFDERLAVLQPSIFELFLQCLLEANVKKYYFPKKQAEQVILGI